MGTSTVMADSGFGAPWTVIGWTVLLTASLYASVLVATRVAGRRTLSQLSAFDALTTIAIGTILGSTAISHQISFVEGVAAMLTLFSLQIVVGYARQRSPALRRALDFPPVTVVRDGEVDLPTGPFGSQLSIDEVRSELRHHGFADPAAVERAVLEPMGGLSVVRAAGVGDRAARRTDEVIRDHLRRRCAGDLDGDLAVNYRGDVVLLSNEGVHHGHDGVRTLAGVLHSYISSGDYSFEPLVTAGQVGLLRWTAHHAGTAIRDGVDSFVVNDGVITAQTIHYSVRRD